MQCAEFQAGTLVLRTDVLPVNCQGAAFVLVASASDAAVQEITAQHMTYAYGFGFGSVILFWSIGYSVGVAKRFLSAV